MTRPPTDAPDVDVSVLIPILNEERHLSEVLALMRGQEFAGAFELLFVDGGSSDRTCEIIAAAAGEDPCVRLLENPARRTPNGLNIGLRHARGKYVARMDAHTRYPVDYLQRGVDRLRRGDVDWVAGPALASGRGPWSHRIALALSFPLGTGGAKFRSSTEAEFDATTGFTGVWRRSKLERHGGWDEGWPVNQDAELAARMRASGERIVCIPAMAAEYFPRDSLWALARQYARYGHYREKTSVRHPESMRLANLLPPSLAMATLAAVLGPRLARRTARGGLVLYLAALCGASGQALRRGERPADAAALPPILTTMHLAHGFGFLSGCLRYGPPLRAIGSVLSLKPKPGVNSESPGTPPPGPPQRP